MDFRKTVVALIVNDDGKFLSLFCTRNNAVDGVQRDQCIWKLPQGGIDDGESVEEACRREIKEELGIDINVNEIVQKKDWCEDFSYYFLDEAGMPCFEIRLHPVLVRLDSEIEIDLDSEENKLYEWVNIDQFLAKNLGIRKKAYQSILRAFSL